MAHADDRVHGRSDLVAHVREEVALGLRRVFGFELRCFEIRIDLLHRPSRARKLLDARPEGLFGLSKLPDDRIQLGFRFPSRRDLGRQPSVPEQGQRYDGKRRGCDPPDERVVDSLRVLDADPSVFDLPVFLLRHRRQDLVDDRDGLRIPRVDAEPVVEPVPRLTRDLEIDEAEIPHHLDGDRHVLHERERAAVGDPQQPFGDIVRLDEPDFGVTHPEVVRGRIPPARGDGPAREFGDVPDVAHVVPRDDHERIRRVRGGRKDLPADVVAARDRRDHVDLAAGVGVEDIGPRIAPSELETQTGALRDDLQVIGDQPVEVAGFADDGHRAPVDLAEGQRSVGFDKRAFGGRERNPDARSGRPGRLPGPLLVEPPDLALRNQLHPPAQDRLQKGAVLPDRRVERERSASRDSDILAADEIPFAELLAEKFDHGNRVDDDIRLPLRDGPDRLARVRRLEEVDRCDAPKGVAERGSLRHRDAPPGEILRQGHARFSPSRERSDFDGRVGGQEGEKSLPFRCRRNTREDIDLPRADLREELVPRSERDEPDVEPRPLREKHHVFDREPFRNAVFEVAQRRAVLVVLDADLPRVREKGPFFVGERGRELGGDLSRVTDDPLLFEVVAVLRGDPAESLLDAREDIRPVARHGGVIDLREERGGFVEGEDIGDSVDAEIVVQPQPRRDEHLDVPPHRGAIEVVEVLVERDPERGEPGPEVVLRVPVRRDSDDHSERVVERSDGADGGMGEQEIVDAQDGSGE